MTKGQKKRRQETKKRTQRHGEEAGERQFVSDGRCDHGLVDFSDGESEEEKTETDTDDDEDYEIFSESCCTS